MKFLKTFWILLCILPFVNSCVEDDEVVDLSQIPAPSEVSANFDITSDDSGLVTVIPTGNAVSSFQVFFGDTENEEATIVAPGRAAEHIYGEGTFTVRVIGVGVSGLTSTFEQPITISFRTPENLVLSVEQSTINPAQVTVSATADFATVFDVYFGDVADEVPTTIMPGASIVHIYEAPGDYTIRVVARGAGAATAEATQVVTVPEANDPIVLPIDFESFTINYGFVSFGNVGAEVVDNPNQTGSNTSARVGQLTKPTGAEVWGGTFLQLGSPIDFSTNKLFKVKVFSPKSGITVKLKVENATDGAIAYEVDVVNTVANDWEELTFDFSAIDVAQEYQKVVIFFDFGVAGDDSVYLFDDIDLVPAQLPESVIIQDFEGTPPAFTVFGDIAPTQVIANPDASGVNTSANVAQFTKSNGSQVWAGTFFETAAPLDLSNYAKIKLKTWSPKSGIVVKLKLENVDASITHEVDIINSATNAWEELIYDFSSAPAADYVRVVVFFDFDIAGDDSLYYFDDIELTNESTPAPPFNLQDFEGTPPAFTVFGDIAPTQVIANPDASGVNTTANVAQFTKSNGSQVWAGTFFETAAPLDLSNYAKIKLKTWSPKSGIVVKLKLENVDASITHEVDIINSATNAWEELIYDFSSAPAADYVRVVVFFDFDIAGDDSLYYFDEFVLDN